MELEQVFSVAGTLALIGWVALAALPRNPFAHLFAAILIPLLLSIGYLFLIAQNLRGAEGGFGSLAEVGTLFQKGEILLAGWIHYLAFDLFIGAWEVRDSQRNGIPHLAIMPCLLMTLLLGPIGLLFYFAIRTAKIRTLGSLT